ncbi:hypothetical protein Tco_0951144 [Tanacetum coccineum]|uniref:Uncharacterized protein n=1 Tax=Tanacetum coccineum TaxID=301880 RepID=A0ABQ5DZZ7_9ASTR
MFESRQTTIPFLSHLNDYYCEEKKGSYGASHIDNSIPQKEKDPGSFTLPCYINNVFFDNAIADLGASVSVMPLSTYLNLGLGELAHTKLTVELANRTVKYPKRIAENVLVELRRDQVDDLMPTIEEGDVIDEPMIDIIKTRNNESFDEEFYKSIIRDKVELKGKNVVGAFMNVPIFVGNFFVVTHFVVVENMDGYRDQDMGDIILGEPFCKASCVEARRNPIKNFKQEIDKRNMFKSNAIGWIGTDISQKVEKPSKSNKTGHGMEKPRCKEIDEVGKEIDEVGEVPIIWNPMCDCTQEHYIAGSSEKDKEPTQEYILFPPHPHRPRISVEDVVQAAQDKPSENFPKDNDVQDSEDVAEKEEQHIQSFEEEKKRAAQATNINKLNTGRPSIGASNSPLVSTANTPYASAASTPTGANTGGSSFVYLGGQIPIDASTLPNADLPYLIPKMPT